MSRQLRRPAPVMVPKVQIQREPKRNSPLGKSGQRSLLLSSRRNRYEFYLQSLSNNTSAKKIARDLICISQFYGITRRPTTSNSKCMRHQNWNSKHDRVYITKTYLTTTAPEPHSLGAAKSVSTMFILSRTLLSSHTPTLFGPSHRN